MASLPFKSARLREDLASVIGPAPWYWQSFPPLASSACQRFVLTSHGESGTLAYLVALALEREPDKPRLALNTYARPFLVPPTHLGVWCPEGPNIRLTCFDPDQLKALQLAEIAGWFKQSGGRIYSATAPTADLEVPASLPPGVNKIEVPSALQTVEELIAPTSYPAASNDDPAFAMYVFYLRSGLAEVLPQRWLTASQYEVGRHWSTRAARDKESQGIVAGGF